MQYPHPFTLATLASTLDNIEVWIRGYMSVYIMYTYVHTLYTLYKDNMNTCTFIQSSRPINLDMHSAAEGTGCAQKVHTDGRHSMRKSRNLYKTPRPTPSHFGIDLYRN